MISDSDATPAVKKTGDDDDEFSPEVCRVPHIQINLKKNIS